jgi:hypothetical protein
VRRERFLCSSQGALVCARHNQKWMRRRRLGLFLFGGVDKNTFAAWR